MGSQPLRVLLVVEQIQQQATESSADNEKRTNLQPLLFVVLPVGVLFFGGVPSTAFPAKGGEGTAVLLG